MDFPEIWKRIKSETDIKKYNQLSDFIGVSQQFVSKKKKQNDFPVEWAFKIGRKYNLLAEWLLTGEGPKRVSDPIRLRRHRYDFLEDLEEWITELVAEEPDRAEWAKHCISDALPAFKEWKKKKEPNLTEEGEYPQDKVA